MKALKNGNTPLVSAKNDGNGYKAFVHSMSQEFKGNCITLNNDGDGGAGLAYYQPCNMFVDSHVTVLYPKFQISKSTMLFIAKSISKQRVLFGHGHSISNSRLHGLSILLPAKSDGTPDYAFMEKYMKRQESKLLGLYAANKLKEYQSEEDSRML